MYFTLTDKICIKINVPDNHISSSIMYGYIKNSRHNKNVMRTIIDELFIKITLMKLYCSEIHVLIVTDYPKLYVHDVTYDTFDKINKIMISKSRSYIECINMTELHDKVSTYIKKNCLDNYPVTFRGNIDKDCSLLNFSHYFTSFRTFGFKTKESIQGTDMIKNVNNKTKLNLLFATCTYILHLLHYPEDNSERKVIIERYKSVEESIRDFIMNLKIQKNLISKIRKLLDEINDIVKFYSFTKSGNALDKIRSNRIITTINKSTLKKFNIDADSSEFVKKIDDIFEEIHDDIQDLNDSDTDSDDDDSICNTAKLSESIELFKSNVSLMSWVEELECSNCMGLGMNIYTSFYNNSYTYCLKSIPISCASVDDSIELLSDNNNLIRLDYTNMAKDTKGSNINICIPLYINKIHWKVAKHYMKIISGLLKYMYPFVNDKRYCDVFYDIYYNNVHILLTTFKKNKASYNEIKLHMSYFKTLIELGKEENINPTYLLENGIYKQFKSFNYSQIIAQSLCHGVKEVLFFDLINMYVKSYSYSMWKKGFCEEYLDVISSKDVEDTFNENKTFLLEIMVMLKWYQFISSFDKSELDDYSVISDETTKEIADLYLMIDCAIENNNVLEIIDGIMAKKYENYHIKNELYASGLEKILTERKIRYNRNLLYSDDPSECLSI